MLAGDRDFLKLIEFLDQKKEKKPEKNWIYSASRFKHENDELIRYFEGELKKFFCQMSYHWNSLSNQSFK